MNKTLHIPVLALCVLGALRCFASETPLPPSPDARAAEAAETPVLDPVVVTAGRPEDKPGSRGLAETDIAPRRASTSDSASLLRDIPGVSTYGAGGISSLPAVHGIADDRLRTQVDGMDLMTACPNHMNPALSFIDPSRVVAVEVFAGIAPVSVGGDSIGGTIRVKPAPPKFADADDGLFAAGRAGLFSRSNGNARGSDAGFTLASRFLSLSYSDSNSESDNYRAADDFKLPGLWKMLGQPGRPLAEDEVGASEYGGSRNRELGLALRLPGNHLIELAAGQQSLDYEGFPNQRMDMVASFPDAGNLYHLDRDKPSNRNRFANLKYTGQFAWGELEARAFRQELKHHMDMLQDRFFGMYMPMDTEATTVGGLLQASINLTATDIVRIGYDFQNYRLDDWWPPLGTFPGSMCCDDFWNIRAGRRDRKAVFAEWEAQWSPAWLTLLGIRGGTVTSDAGPAQGYSIMYAGDAARFNARDRADRDRHVDWTALVRHSPGATSAYEAGIARKTRSPNLYERYPWSYNSMAALMNNFVGDGNGYIGNPDLKPEIAHTLAASAAWHDANQERWRLKLTGHVTHVRDFIDARRCTPAMNTQCPASNATTTSGYVKLQYVNQSARLYGIDLSGQAELGRIEGIGGFSVNGTMSFVRGQNRSTGDDLYHIMPLDTRLALVHRLGGWTNTLEIEAVEDKKQVSHVRNEVQTPDYTLLHLRTSYEWQHARLDIAVENALDKFYLLPLGGAYVGQGNAMTINGVPWGMVVPGRGRSVNVALSFRF